jgi:NTE family protein
MPQSPSENFQGQAPGFAEAPIKTVNLAIQGGGAHGAFGWGVIDALLEDGRLNFEGVSGTSAGSMNAVILAEGLRKGGNAGGRQALEDFWQDVSSAGRLYNPVQRAPWEFLLYGWRMENSPAFEWFNSMTRWFSPYQLNPFDFNPLRDVLEAHVDFTALRACTSVKLFLSATNVRTGKVRVFDTAETTADAVMASACLPYLFKAVEIQGEFYWDGGYMGNPALFPFHYKTNAQDLVIVHINPIERQGPPMMPNEIFNRVNEVSFNASLLHELRSIAFVQKLLDQDWIKPEYRSRLKSIRVHPIRADAALSDLSVASKFASDWNFLRMLRDRGRSVGAAWVQRVYEDIGIRSSADLNEEYLR